MSLRRRSALALPLFAALTLTATTFAHADSLKGTTVSGAIVSDNSDITVSSQFASPTTIGSGKDFSGSITDVGFGQVFDLGVNFTNTGLTVTVTNPKSSDNNLSDPATPNFFSLTFTDTAFANSLFPLTSYGCNSNAGNACNILDPSSGLNGDTLTGDTLTLDFNNVFVGQVYTFTDTAVTAQTPEPSSIALLGTGLLGALGVARRRLSA